MNNLLGEKFGRLTILKDAGSDKHKNKLWDCICECGNEKTVGGYMLLSGNTSSCGCYRKEVTQVRSTTHGHKKGRVTTPEYNSWNGMIKRCTQPGQKAFQDYGGRGIKVCDRWLHSFENFLSDMGEKPSNKHSIERNDVNGNYSPENCRWATRNEQARNIRVPRANKSGLTGVHWCQRDSRWIAQITIENKRIRLGNFIEKNEAIEARKRAEIEYWNIQPS